MLRCAHSAADSGPARALSARRRGVEIAADQPQHLGGGIADQRAIAGDRAREHVVDHHGRDGGGKPESGRQQRLGDARRHHREVGGLRLSRCR